MAYSYQGLPLTPAIIAELVIELFSGSTVERDQMIRDVVQAHIKRGGKQSRSTDLGDSAFKALRSLRSKGLATNASVGFWRIGAIQDASSASEPVVVASTVEAVEDDLAQVIGGSVYLYYLPLYRQNAERDGKRVWPCKIGKSGRDPLARILAQAATALPELPEVSLVFDSDQASALETHFMRYLQSARRESMARRETNGFSLLLRRSPPLLQA